MAKAASTKKYLGFIPCQVGLNLRDLELTNGVTNHTIQARVDRLFE